MKRFIAILLVWPLIGSTLTLAQDDVLVESIFPDKNLEKAVRPYVFAKRNNEEPITAEDVINISTVKGRDLQINDLTGLELCKSLALLDLAHNEITDLTPLAGLKRLQSLTLTDNKISDIKPRGTVQALQYLELSTNSVSEITPLQTLTNMNSLYLNHNRIKDLKPVIKLNKLWSLYLDNNRIDSISGIFYLDRLNTLSVRNNQIEDISPLFGLKQLYYLFLENNNITDLGALCRIIEADSKGERRFSPFVKIYVEGNPLDFDARRKQLAHIKECGAKVFY